MSEKIEINALLERGVKVKIGRFNFVIKEPYLGTLDYISKYNLDMAYDEQKLEQNERYEAHNVVRSGADNWPYVLACMILNNKTKIRLFGRILATYIRANIKPSDCVELIQITTKMQNLELFIATIKLMSGVRTTKPNLIVQPNEKA